MGLQEVFDRQRPVLVGAVGGEHHGVFRRDLGAERQTHRHAIDHRLGAHGDELGRIGARAGAAEPYDIDMFFAFHLAQHANGFA